MLKTMRRFSISSLFFYLILFLAANTCAKEIREFPNLPHCGQPIDLISPTNYVLGGSITAIGEDPWIALLMFRDRLTKKAEYLCSGSLINHRYVVTAAHCFQDQFLEKNMLYHIRLGEHNISSPSESYFDHDVVLHAYDFEVKDYILHPDFNNDSLFSNDIALIQLATDVNFEKYYGQINAICLPSRKVNFHAPDELLSSVFRIVGWNFGAGRPSDTLRMSEANLIADEYCSRMYRGVIGSTKLCVSVTSGDCVGDSGSPLVSYAGSYYDRRRLLGVLSMTFPHMCRQYPSIYTSIVPFIDWIAENSQ